MTDFGSHTEADAGRFEFVHADRPSRYQSRVSDDAFDPAEESA